MDVRSIMTTEVVTVHAEARLGEALERMDEADVRHLPVVEEDEEGRPGLVGVISDRDLLTETGWLPARVVESRGGTAEHQREHRVRQVMREPITVSPDEKVGEVAERLMDQHIGCLPVVEKGALVGIVTHRDILEACTKSTAAGAPDPKVSSYMTEKPKVLELGATLLQAEELCQGADIRHVPVLHMDRVVGMVSDRDLRRARGCGRQDDWLVNDLMTDSILEVARNAPVSEAARAMAEHKISSLPVVEDRKLVGILTITDVLEHCVNILGEKG